MKHVSIITILLFAISCSSQSGMMTSRTSTSTAKSVGGLTKIDQIDLSIKLPSQWSSQGEMSAGSMQGHNFIRSTVTGKDGKAVAAFMGIMYEKIGGGGNIIMYSMQKRMALPKMEILEVLSGDSKSFKVKTGMGYLATYSDKQNNLHKIIIVHMIKGEYGIQMIIDGTESVFDQLKGEYTQILNSINFGS